MKDWLNSGAAEIAQDLIRLNGSAFSGQVSGYGLRHRVNDLIRELKCALFPFVFESGDTNEKYLDRTVHKRVTGSAILLNLLAAQVLGKRSREGLVQDPEETADRVTVDFISRLPAVREKLEGDVQAAFDGDPAAKSVEEVILSYPCVQAIMTYRLAHELWIRDIPLIPRMMTEIAHESTGIDIHPGAVIGSRFFIDHGTGVVIGETTVIGDNVKLYQGVTLGAKSFVTDEKGTILAVKRHPDIEDNVVVYSGASILGGDVVVGHDSVIGGNVWLTKSVAPFSTVINSTPHPIIREWNTNGPDSYQI